MKIVQNVDTVQIKDVPPMCVIISKTKSGAFFDVLLSEYFDKKEKWAWFALDNCSHRSCNDWFNSRAEAIIYMLSLGFNVEFFETGAEGNLAFKNWCNNNISE